MSPVESPQREPALAVSNDAFASLPHASSTEQQQPFDHLHSTTQGSPFQGVLPASERLNIQLHEQSILQDPSPSQDDITLHLYVGLPAIMAGVNDWTFQGLTERNARRGCCRVRAVK